jgi:hypothetical protein
MMCAAPCVMAQGQDSTAFFSVLGMLNDYAARVVYPGDSLVEFLYPGEAVPAEVFERCLNEMKNEMHFTGAITKEIGKEGHYYIYSREVAAAIDSCFVFDFSQSGAYRIIDGRDVREYWSKTLKHGVVASVRGNDAYALAFLEGVYLRNARDDIMIQLGIFTDRGGGRDPLKRARLSFAHSYFKADLTELLLRHLGCERIEVLQHSGIPGDTEICFDPSPIILSKVILPAIEEYERSPNKPVPCLH